MSPIRSKKSDSDNAENYNSGHRDRLRQRFLLNGFEGMLNYEVLECLLTMVIPRKDVKPLAKRLLDQYDSIHSILNLPVEKLEKTKGLGHNSAVGLKMIGSICDYCLQERIRHRNLLNSSEAVKNYVRMKLGVRKRESFMLLLLDSRFHLVDSAMIAEGTSNQVISYLRNVVHESVLIQDASFVILVHNHPSGVCKPSQEDIKATIGISHSLALVGMLLLDHLIVSRNDCFSFRENGIDLDTGKEVKHE